MSVDSLMQSRVIEKIYELLKPYGSSERITILTSAACLLGCVPQERQQELIVELLTGKVKPEKQPEKTEGAT